MCYGFEQFTLEMERIWYYNLIWTLHFGNGLGLALRILEHFILAYFDLFLFVLICLCSCVGIIYIVRICQIFRIGTVYYKGYL